MEYVCNQRRPKQIKINPAGFEQVNDVVLACSSVCLPGCQKLRPSPQWAPTNAQLAGSTRLCLLLACNAQQQRATSPDRNSYHPRICPCAYRPYRDRHRNSGPNRSGVDDIVTVAIMAPIVAGASRPALSGFFQQTLKSLQVFVAHFGV